MNTSVSESLEETVVIKVVSFYLSGQMEKRNIIFEILGDSPDTQAISDMVEEIIGVRLNYRLSPGLENSKMLFVFREDDVYAKQVLMKLWKK